MTSCPSYFIFLVCGSQQEIQGIAILTGYLAPILSRRQTAFQKLEHAEKCTEPSVGVSYNILKTLNQMKHFQQPQSETFMKFKGPKSSVSESDYSKSSRVAAG